jgi:hypothetical protein
LITLLIRFHRGGDARAMQFTPNLCVGLSCRALERRLFIGDDRTGEDAFCALENAGSAFSSANNRK